ncbi:MAG: hypothetical protein ACPGSB_10770 [Opitutales bacterium]
MMPEIAMLRKSMAASVEIQWRFTIIAGTMALSHKTVTLTIIGKGP